MSIWKYTFPVDDIVTVRMPIGCEIISIGSQAVNTISLWAIVDRDAGLSDRTIRVFGTGHEFIPCGKFLGTAFDGPFVWHVFDGDA